MIPGAFTGITPIMLRNPFLHMFIQGSFSAQPPGMTGISVIELHTDKEDHKCQKNLSTALWFVWSVRQIKLFKNNELKGRKKTVLSPRLMTNIICFFFFYHRQNKTGRRDKYKAWLESLYTSIGWVPAVHLFHLWMNILIYIIESDHGRSLSNHVFRNQTMEWRKNDSRSQVPTIDVSRLAHSHIHTPVSPY